MRTGKLITKRYFWYVVVMAFITCTLSYSPQLTTLFRLPAMTDWQIAYYSAAYRLLFPLTVIIAAWQFGVKGGLVVCLVVGPVIISSVLVNSKLPNGLIDFADVAIGFLLNWMVGVQGQLKRRLEATAVELQRQSAALTLEIGERRRAEEEYRLVAENTVDVIFKFRLSDGQYLFVSPSAEKLFGYTQAEAMKMKPSDILTPESYQMQALELAKDIERGSSVRTLQLDAVHKDGHIIPVEVSSRLITDKNGQPSEIVGVARDITERRRMEEQLITRDRLASIGQLSAGMAHEINNPLTGVVTFSALLLDKDLSPETKADLKVINEQAKRAARIVQNLLTFARKQPQEKQPTNINERIRKILELRAYEQKVNNIRLESNLAPDLPDVFGNSFQLEQVFFNIIINAEFFMTEAHGKGVLTITTEKAGDFVRASVADDGPGISEENMRSLFNPFFTTKEIGKGTGLGLSICHGIITEHGGRIWAENRQGKGTVFIIELHVYEAYARS
jgi:PAS domain S-box-containing protein